MTEYNIFCYSETYNDDDSFQKERYRAFNKSVGEQRYKDILALVRKIIPNTDKLELIPFWKSVTQDQWRKLLAIPEAVDFKDGFEYISGQKIITEQNMIEVAE